MPARTFRSSKTGSGMPISRTPRFMPSSPTQPGTRKPANYSRATGWGGERNKKARTLRALLCFCASNWIYFFIGTTAAAKLSTISSLSFARTTGALTPPQPCEPALAPHSLTVAGVANLCHSVARSGTRKVNFVCRGALPVIHSSPHSPSRPPKPQLLCAKRLPSVSKNWLCSRQRRRDGKAWRGDQPEGSARW